MKNLMNHLTLIGMIVVLTSTFQSCDQKGKAVGDKFDEPEYFLLRPEVEKAYDYSHAVKIGNSIKVSGAVKNKS